MAHAPCHAAPTVARCALNACSSRVNRLPAGMARCGAKKRVALPRLHTYRRLQCGEEGTPQQLPRASSPPETDGRRRATSGGPRVRAGARGDGQAGEQPGVGAAQAEEAAGGAPGAGEGGGRGHGALRPRPRQHVRTPPANLCPHPVDSPRPDAHGSRYSILDSISSTFAGSRSSAHRSVFDFVCASVLRPPSG